MKKLLVLLVVVLLVIMVTTAAFAHPAVPEQSLQKVSMNAVNGMHTAWGNIQGSNGIAKHVFMFRHSPH
jgi:hypothetical protein